MDFDEVVVKESPGLCRCCLSEGCYKDLGSEYSWMGDTEIYADMLLECFDIGISQHIEGPNGPNRLICEVCITRLRDACNFKKQVVESEKKFVDMVGRGEFRDKAVVFEGMKTEPPPQAEALDVEYLDDIDFGEEADPEDLLKTDTDAEGTEDITVAALPVKRGRGRPRKHPAVKPEKKSKLAKYEEKARSSKSSAKGVVKIKEEKPNCVEKLANIRRNIALLLHYGNVTPFQWISTRFKCFYCSKDITDCDNLISHTNQKHSNLHLEEFIKKRVKSKDVPIKLDVQNIACKVCLEPIDSLQGLIRHIIQTHEDNYDVEVGVCAFPFVLTKDEYACTQCEDRFDNFSSLVSHMYKMHVSHSYVCQICGLSFLYKDRMMRHFNNSHVGYRCSICKKMFKGQKTLARHKELKHGQVKVHNCSLCSLRFHNDYQLKVHMGKAHNVEKFVIRCEMCPKVCNTKGALLIHMQSKHSEATYECDMCDYKASIKWLIKLHKRKHLGERDYECSICKRKFGRSSNLRTHMKVHTGNFGRVCRKCRHGFVDVEELRSHEREVHYVD